MAHRCVDWTRDPPARKIPLLVLAHGDDRVYTPVPTEFEALEEVARREFRLGDVDVVLTSSCLNLCDGQPARITADAWEHTSPYIGCATVDVPAAPPREQSDGTRDARDSQQRLPLHAEEANGNDQLAGEPNASTSEAVRGALSDHNTASTSGDHHEEPWEEEEVSAVLPPRSRNRRRVVSEDEGNDEAERSEGDVPPKSPVPRVASPPKPTQPSAVVYTDLADGVTADKGVKKENISDDRSPPADPKEEPLKIKQEKVESGNAHASDGGSRPRHAESQHEARAQADPGDNNHKLMIRVAHRPSQQESKFTMKSATKVAKVLTSTCKSFGLDASGATLYLIVVMEDEFGEVENLFPCDRNDTIVRAGAEHDTESRFLLKMAGEP